MVNALILSRVPAVLVAGDSLHVVRSDLAAGYPIGDGFSLSYVFSPLRGGTPVTVAADDSVDGWALAVPAATTAAWAAGTWRWVALAEKGDDRYSVDGGTFAVSANPTAANVDGRSHAQRVLDAVEAAIEGRASATDLEVSFEDGSQIKQMDHAQLLVLRDRYARLVATENRRAGRGGPRRVLVSL